MGNRRFQLDAILVLVVILSLAAMLQSCNFPTEEARRAIQDSSPLSGAVPTMPAPEDEFRPRTEIILDGSRADSGIFRGSVQVTLRSDDPSGIERIDYSLDQGETWEQYTGPFMLEHGTFPREWDPDTDPSDVFAGGPGRFLVLASAVDRAGNVEDPPAFRLVTIEPPSGTATVPISTPSMVSLGGIPSQPATCRGGPSTVYGVVRYLEAGIPLEINGRNEDLTWLRIEGEEEGSCWVASRLIAPDDVETLPALPVPEIPPTPTWTPEPPTEQPSNGGEGPAGCLYQPDDQNQPICYPIDQCPVPFEQSEGACQP